MIPVRVTVRAPNLRARGRVEMWAAESLDGEWSFIREERPGTPWAVLHRPSNWNGLYASLLKARRSAAGDLGFELAWKIIDLLGNR